MDSKLKKPSHWVALQAAVARAAVPLSMAVCAALLSACDHKKDAISARLKGADISTNYPATDYIQQAPGTPGGVLKVSVASDTGSLDLHAISHTNAQWLGRVIYDNLVYLDPQGEISPWLAKSWTISPDGKVYTFKLRDDVTFSDGTKFNAEAVRVNLEHMRDPATKSPLAAAYIAPYKNGRAIDDYTFEATLSEPYSPFLNVLAQSWLSMESPKAIKENPKGLGDAPVGSGPFIVESYTRQQGIRLKRRDDYHWAPDIVKHTGPAYLDRIEIEFVAEPVLRYNGLASGQFNFTIDAPAQNAAAIRSSDDLVLTSRVRTGIPSRGVTFNVGKPPFTDINVRKAFALAIDREGIVQSTGFGEYKIKSDFLASNTRYYDPSGKDQLRYAPEISNQLLDASGWKERDAQGFRVKDGQRLAAELLTTETATPSPILAAIQSDVKKIGFDLKIVQLPAAQLTDRRNSNDYQALGGGVWHTNTPDALYINYHSDSITTPKRIGQNTAHLQDAQLDDVLLKARHTTDPKLLQSLYSQAQLRVIELVPAVPLYENASSVAFSKNVKGVIYDTSHNTPYFPAVWIDKSAP
jgi:peptide/nickel transport system substrate-binding protein